MKNIINFDNGATTQPLQVTKVAAENFLNTYGSIHRGHGINSRISTDSYELARKNIAKLIKCKDNDVVVFTGNSTFSLNLLSDILSPLGGEVLVSDIEHSSNILSWKRNFPVKYIDSGDKFHINTEDITKNINANTKILAISGASNLTGYVQDDLFNIYNLCQNKGILFVIDGSQLSPHYKIDMNTCDFMVFSGHKTYAPYGGGCLVGNKELLQGIGKASLGGGNIIYFDDDITLYKEAPYCLESGTPNALGAITLEASLNYLYSNNMEEHTRDISFYMYSKLKDLEGMFGFKVKFRKLMPVNAKFTPVITVTTKNNRRVSDLLFKENVQFRMGNFCLYNLAIKDNNINRQDFVSEIYLENKIPDKYSYIRFSGGFNTSKTDIDELYNRLLKVLNACESEEFLKQKLSHIPISINNMYGDPLMQWDNTIEKLNKLLSEKHKGVISIITKGCFSNLKCEQIEKYRRLGLNIIVLVSVSGLPTSIEPVSLEARLNGLANLKRYKIPAIPYLRPFIAGLNDKIEVLENLFQSISEIGYKEVIISGFRGSDDIVSRTIDTNKAKANFMVRVKTMPEGISSTLNELSEKYNIFLHKRTSCGVASVLGLKHSWNPYTESPNMAGCKDCPIKTSCFDKRSDVKVTEKEINLLSYLGYDVNYESRKIDAQLCATISDNRSECPSCCTTCYRLKGIERINVSNAKSLGDLAFMRFLIGKGVVISQNNLVDKETPDTGKFRLNAISGMCVNTWYVMANNTDKCFGCSYCITDIYKNPIGEIGCSPMELYEKIITQEG